MSYFQSLRVNTFLECTRLNKCVIIHKGVLQRAIYSLFGVFEFKRNIVLNENCMIQIFILHKYGNNFLE